MFGAKIWQVIVIVLSLAGSGVAIYMNAVGGEREEFASSMEVADIQTGDLYRIPLGGKRAVMLPMAPPGKTALTLYPVYSKDGKWFIEKRYVEGNSKALDGATACDPKTLEVKVNGPAKELNP